MIIDFFPRVDWFLKRFRSSAYIANNRFKVYKHNSRQSLLLILLDWWDTCHRTLIAEPCRVEIKNESSQTTWTPCFVLLLLLRPWYRTQIYLGQQTSFQQNAGLGLVNKLWPKVSKKYVRRKSFPEFTSPRSASFEHDEKSLIKTTLWVWEVEWIKL